MQAIENLTRLRGRILSVVPHPQRPGYALVTLHLSATEAVPGKADLLSRWRGTALQVAVRDGLLPAACVGAQADLRARMTPDGALAEPHPEPGNFHIAAGTASD